MDYVFIIDVNSMCGNDSVDTREVNDDNNLLVNDNNDEHRCNFVKAELIRVGKIFIAAIRIPFVSMANDLTTLKDGL